MGAESIDWSGMKFIIAEEMGECMDSIFQRYDAHTGQSEYFLVNHKYHDGVGGFTRILESKFAFTCSQMPQIKSAPRLNFWQKMQKLLQFIKLTKKVQTRWLKPRRDMTGKSLGYISAFIPNKLKDDLEVKLKEQGISLNAYLFWAIDRAASEAFLVPGCERKWVSPVNMRGAVETQNSYGNVAASIILNFKGDETPSHIQQSIRDYFQSHIYMGSWLYTNMAKFVGLWGARRIARKIKDVGVGVFSNMGIWPPASYQGQTENGRYHWIAAAPASQVLPVAAVAFQWESQLSLSLHLHPSLERDLDFAQQLMKRYLEIIFEDSDQGIPIVQNRREELYKIALRIA